MGNAANAAACILSPCVFVYCGAWGEVGGCKIKNVSAHATFALYEPVYISIYLYIYTVSLVEPSS